MNQMAQSISLQLTFTAYSKIDMLSSYSLTLLNKYKTYLNKFSLMMLVSKVLIRQNDFLNKGY